ncbi:MAG: hypothetical protein ABIH70_08050 [Chloroflexota bacterium]
MSDKRLLIVDTDLLNKIDENRGEMNRGDFLRFLLDNCLQEDSANQNNQVTKEEFKQFQQGTRDLLRSFLEFFISYGLELGKQPEDKTFDELNQKLQALGSAATKAKNR